MDDALQQEVALLRRLLYRMKNQHRATWIYKKMQHLSRTVNKDAVRAQAVCEDLYVLCTSSLALGHFVSLMTIVMGISARIRFLVRGRSDDEIDAIFAHVN